MFIWADMPSDTTIDLEATFLYNKARRMAMLAEPVNHEKTIVGMNISKIDEVLRDSVGRKLFEAVLSLIGQDGHTFHLQNRHMQSDYVS